MNKCTLDRTKQEIDEAIGFMPGYAGAGQEYVNMQPVLSKLVSKYDADTLRMVLADFKRCEFGKASV